MASTNILDYAPRFQFGQPGVPWTLQKTACTDTCIQMVIAYYKDRVPTLMEVRKDSGKQPAWGDGKGLTVTQTLNALNANGVTHYRWTLGYDRTFMLARLKVGPIIVSTNYKYYPIWKDKKCDRGTNLAQIGGKTDCYFNGAHAVLVIKAIPVYSGGKLLRYDYLVRDPDHGSPGRPEKPKYDRMTESQLKRAMEYVKYLGGGWTKPSVVYPTRKKVL